MWAVEPESMVAPRGLMIARRARWMGQCVRVSFRLAPCEMHASAAWSGAGGGRRRPSSLPRLLGGERNWAAGMIGLVGT